MADEQKTGAGEGGKDASLTVAQRFESAREIVNEILCELQFIRDGLKANNGVGGNECNEFSVTGGQTLLAGTISKLDFLVGDLAELEKATQPLLADGGEVAHG